MGPLFADRQMTYEAAVRAHKDAGHPGQFSACAKPACAENRAKCLPTMVSARTRGPGRPLIVN